MLKTEKEVLEVAIRERDVMFLTKYFFDFDLTAGQEEIVKDIAFGIYKRISINCYTRYGKTQCVAIGVCIYILLNRDKKIAIIAPQADQTDILREYIIDCVIKSPQLQSIIELEKTRDIKTMKKEASKVRQTFSNGCEYRVFSAHGEANRIMGFGADLTVKDEAAKISREASAKIFRMTGDDPDHAVLVEITNPWDRNTVAGDHYFDVRWKRIHIDWRQGVREGRTTLAHVEEARGEMTQMEFEVLYESNYPEETEDALFRWNWIEGAIDKLKIDNPNKIKAKFLGCDIAEGGIDWTVVTSINAMMDGTYIISDITPWHKADTMVTTGKIIKMHNEFNSKYIKVDAIGVGKGVCDRLAEQGYPVQPIKVGMSATVEKDKFMNQKAQYYWELRGLFEEGRISIPKNHNLINELRAMRYELTSSGKIRILDPEDKSPDYSDSLMLGCSEGFVSCVVM